MLEALWSVEFISTLGGWGGGVVVFETQRVFGGDSHYYYMGHYEVKNDIVQGEVEVNFYGSIPASIFGPMHKFRVALSGKISPKVMELQGHLVGDPTKRMDVRLTRRAELP